VARADAARGICVRATGFAFRWEVAVLAAAADACVGRAAIVTSVAGIAGVATPVASAVPSTAGCTVDPCVAIRRRESAGGRVAVHSRRHGRCTARQGYAAVEQRCAGFVEAADASVGAAVADCVGRVRCEPSSAAGARRVARLAVRQAAGTQAAGGLHADSGVDHAGSSADGAAAGESGCAQASGCAVADGAHSGDRGRRDSRDHTHSVFRAATARASGGATADSDTGRDRTAKKSVRNL